MRKSFLSGVLEAFATAAAAAAPLQVSALHPLMADLARQVGGDRVLEHDRIRPRLQAGTAGARLVMHAEHDQRLPGAAGAQPADDAQAVTAHQREIHEYELNQDLNV